MHVEWKPSETSEMKSSLFAYPLIRVIYLNPNHCLRHCELTFSDLGLHLENINIRKKEEITLPDCFFNFYDTDKRIYINGGIDISASWFGGLDITYANFSNAPGGIMIVGIPFGFGGGANIVTGGQLIPLN